MKSVAINLTLFKVAWLAVVFGAAASLASLGTAVVGAAVIVHLFRAARPRREVLLMTAAALIGAAWESYLIQAGVLQYPGFSSAAFAPYWIVAMWVLFATTLNLGMRWLRKNYVMASIFGAVGGPLSFAAGEKAGAVTIAENGFLTIAVGWALLLPLMTYLASRLDGYELPERQRLVADVS